MYRAPENQADTVGEPIWDAVVIGTGMGGAAIGCRLAEAGFRVLFLEKGGNVAPGSGLDMPETTAARRAAGYWPDPVRVEVDGIGSDMLLPLGSGIGGSTNLYSAALERFDRSDVEDDTAAPHPTGGWPVPWREWTRFYAEAERRLRVRGGAALGEGAPDIPSHASPDGGDPLGDPPIASDMDRGFAARLARNGLSPYPLHVGIGYRPGCTECGGHKCPIRCKSDAQLIFIDPALKSGNATVRAECEVLRLDADDTAVRRVIYRRGGREEAVAGRIVVLAAGAYHSPAVLLRSANRHWRTGLANRSDQVGRNLMFHANEWLAVWPARRLSTAGPRKTIGFRDHYRASGARLGQVQSTGMSATFGNICGFLMTRLAASRWGRVKGVDKAIKLAALIAVRLFGNATIFVMLVEDFGLPENRVTLDPADPARITVRYTINDDLTRRAKLARGLLRRSFAGLRRLTLQGAVQLNLGHACGTCRFGTDPESSVLDPDCRAHGVSNLYVVDASFMPTSAGVNPALTIAANALRVAEIVIDRHRAGSHSTKSPGAAQRRGQPA